jgi:hypothetical protein
VHGPVSTYFSRDLHVKKGTIIGLFVGVGLFVLLNQALPERVCKDGWKSPSIGRPGACSHHGGVKTSVLPLLVLLTSIGAGTLVGKLVNQTSWAQPRPAKDKKDQPTQRPHETPYGTLRDHEAHLRKLGISEKQIQIELDKYR